MDVEAAAQLMGMKPHTEVLDVVEVNGGHLVSTHDGQRTLIRDDGSMHLAAVDEFADPDAEQPPYPEGGSTKEVLAWVGEDPDRAVEALDIERARETPRSTLVAALEKAAG